MMGGMDNHNRLVSPIYIDNFQNCGSCRYEIIQSHVTTGVRKCVCYLILAEETVWKTRDSRKYGQHEPGCWKKKPSETVKHCQ